MIPEKNYVRIMSEQIVFEINRIFHQVEAELYAERHNEICSNRKLVNDWMQFAYIINTTFDHPVCILDFGTGTGFVPSVIIGRIRNLKKLVSCDISLNMLKIARLKIPCATFVLLDQSGKIPCKDMSFDVITVNSVLHHLFDVELWCKEFDKLLSPGGLIIISNENSNRFVRNKV